MNGKTYAGVGSRRSPSAALAAMVSVAEKLALADWTLRSGAAMGADIAFEKGCDAAKGRKEIYIPWEGFSAEGRNAAPHNRRRTTETGVMLPANRTAAERIAQAHWHGQNWNGMSQGIRGLMGRNACQILGEQLDDPVKAVIYWAPIPESGGTRMALRIARAHGIDCHRITGTDDCAAILETLTEVETG